MVCGGHCSLGTEWSYSVIGNNVVNKLQVLLFTQMIIIDKKVNTTFINEFANGTCFWILEHPCSAQFFRQLCCHICDNALHLSHLPWLLLSNPHNPREPRTTQPFVLYFCRMPLPLRVRVTLSQFTEEKAG